MVLGNAFSTASFAHELPISKNVYTQIYSI